ncbi:hypothetical protein [Microbacterium hominis]|uniref:Uncharacterized protein n=1 Tax=Microbacterium hominis TaxID=162426 RepID=A0A7D4Q7K1_9MICO|nr:hypothetical protein [Microbacterium hominis]QKJ19099.1 hypothetical protein HQM25_06735 [Microbacterium hominis]
MPSITPTDIPLHLARDPGSRGAHRRTTLVRVRPGVYADAARWAQLRPWERYRARVRAVAASWRDPVFCLESAAVLLGAPVFDEPRDIHILDPGGKSRRVGDVVVHATRDEVGPERRDGIALTPLVATAVALCRIIPPAFALAVADHALRSIDEPIDFAAIGRAQSDRRGRAALDWVSERATAAAESVGESISRAVIEWLGFEEPELQVVFQHEGFTDRVDFAWRRARVLGESDGWGKYDAGDAHAVRAHFVGEKRREDRLRRHEGPMARWEYRDAMRAVPLGEKLALAGLEATRPPHLAMLATLRHNPRSLPRTAR